MCRPGACSIPRLTDMSAYSLSIDRLEHLTALDKPFYIQIAPTAPHVQRDGPPVPLERHMYSLLNVTAPRPPNFNPPDEVQQNKVSYMKRLHRLNETELNFVDWGYRARQQSLLGIDELVEDVVDFLGQKDVLDNTYGMFSLCTLFPRCLSDILLQDEANCIL